MPTAKLSDAQPITPQGGKAKLSDLDSPNLPDSSTPPSMASEIGHGAMDFGKGMLKGAGSTLNTIGSAMIPDRLVKAFGATPTPSNPSIFEPSNTAQSVGKGVEQAGEFLIPGIGEEALAAKAAKFGKYAPMAARIVQQALGSGLVNKIQGGDFGTGAIGGAVGGAVGEGVRAVAPAAMEIAQGIKGTAGRKTGQALLKETSGVLPGSVKKSAQGVLDKLNPELDAAAANAPNPINLGSARQAAADQVAKATFQNEPKLIKGTQRLANQITDRAGVPIPADVPATEYLGLKRGIGKALPAGSWSPASTNAFVGPRNAVYGEMNKAFESAVPEAGPLNRRISALIPATEPATKSLWGHAAGPLAGAGFGGIEGFNHGGVPGALKGALIGGTIGAAAPAALNTAARYGKYAVRPAVGAALQADRKEKK